MWFRGDRQVCVQLCGFFITWALNLVQTSEYRCSSHLCVCRQVYKCPVQWQTRVLLTCTRSHTAALREIIVAVASAPSIDKDFTASRLAVVVPASEGCSAGAHNRLGPTALWAKWKIKQDDYFAVFNVKLLLEMWKCLNLGKKIALTFLSPIDSTTITVKKNNENKFNILTWQKGTKLFLCVCSSSITT